MLYHSAISLLSQPTAFSPSLFCFTQFFSTRTTTVFVNGVLDTEGVLTKQHKKRRISLRFYSVSPILNSTVSYSTLLCSLVVAPWEGSEMGKGEQTTSPQLCRIGFLSVASQLALWLCVCKCVAVCS